MKRLHSIRNLLCLCFAVISSATFALAQSDPKPSSPGGTGSAVRDRTRSRRVVSDVSEEKAVETSAKPAEAEPAPPVPPAPKPAETKAAGEKKEPSTSVPSPATQNDPLLVLRDQIGAAASVQEKVRLQLQLVELLVANGSKQDAINELHSMSGEEGFNPQGFYNIGNALARLGDGDGAALAYRKAIDQRKGGYSRALNNLGVVLTRQGRWDEAYDAFNSALRLESFRYAEASYNLGRLYWSRGEIDLAIREWQRAVRVDPDHTAAALALAAVNNQARVAVATPPKRFGSTENKVPLNAAAKQPAADPVTSSIRSKPVAAAGSQSVDPETYSLLQRARTAHERGRQEEAVTNYRRVISRMGGYFALANLELSYALITLKRSDEAIASLVVVTQRDGGRYPISYYHLARLYEARGELKLAEENYSRAAASYGQDNGQFLLDLSRMREKLGDLQGALTTLEEYVAVMERNNVKPDWSDERLASLRQRLAASQPKP